MCGDGVNEGVSQLDGTENDQANVICACKEESVSFIEEWWFIADQDILQNCTVVLIELHKIAQIDHQNDFVSPPNGRLQDDTLKAGHATL